MKDHKKVEGHQFRSNLRKWDEIENTLSDLVTFKECKKANWKNKKKYSKLPLFFEFLFKLYNLGTVESHSGFFESNLRMSLEHGMIFKFSNTVMVGRWWRWIIRILTYLENWAKSGFIINSIKKQFWSFINNSKITSKFKRRVLGTNRNF